MYNAKRLNLKRLFLRSTKEINDLDIFDDGVKSIFDFGKNDLMAHFIYCGSHYFYRKEQRQKLEKMILTKMKKYGIQSLVLTMLWMMRRNLVTKEKVKKAAGKLKNEDLWKDCEGSINDDLERFFINLQNQKEVEYEGVFSFFTPKLTNEELKLVQEVDEDHLKTYSEYFYGRNPDVDVHEMKQSNSKSKYVLGRCFRWTIPLRLEITANEDEVLDEKEIERIAFQNLPPETVNYISDLDHIS